MPGDPAILTQIVLRSLIDPNFQTEGASIPWIKEDTNFKIIGDFLRSLATVPTDTTGFEEYNAGTTYEDGDFVAYNGNIYEYINVVPSAGVTPGTDILYWEISSQGQFAHQQNKDQYLDFGGTYQVSAQDIYNFINAVYPYLIQGTNTLTEDTTIFNNGFSFLISSGADEDAAQAYKLIVEAAGAGLAYTDINIPSNNAAIVVAPSVIMINGDLQLNNGVIYWKGAKDSPAEGDIREYYNEGTDEIITEKYTSGSWTFRGSR